MVRDKICDVYKRARGVVKLSHQRLIIGLKFYSFVHISPTNEQVLMSIVRNIDPKRCFVTKVSDKRLKMVLDVHLIDPATLFVTIRDLN